MTTSDGISKKDWNKIEQLAALIASSIETGEDVVKFNDELLMRLDLLEKKYGRLPSIIATRADYTDCISQQLILLKEAYSSAFEINDKKNMAYISASIAELYMENEYDPRKLLLWASVFSIYIDSMTSNDEYLVYVRDEINQYLICTTGVSLKDSLAQSRLI